MTESTVLYSTYNEEEPGWLPKVVFKKMPKVQHTGLTTPMQRRKRRIYSAIWQHKKRGGEEENLGKRIKC